MTPCTEPQTSMARQDESSRKPKWIQNAFLSSDILHLISSKHKPKNSRYSSKLKNKGPKHNIESKGLNRRSCKCKKVG